MARWWQIFTAVSIGDPDNNQNVLKPNEDGSLNVNSTPINNTPANIATNTGTLLKTGAGTLASVTVNQKGTVASVINIYDGTTSGGKLLATIDSLNLQGQFVYNIAFTVGLFVQSTGTVAPNYTVAYR